MNLKNKILSAKEIPFLIKNKDFVIIGGNGGTGAPEKILIEIEKSYLKRKRPKNLTIFHITGLGAVDKYGLNHLNHSGLVSKVIGGNFGLQIPFMKNLIVGNKIEAYNFPQGILSQMCRTMASKQPGIITKVGLNTYMDPRIEGGKMNKKTKKNLVNLIKIKGQEYLFYLAHKPDFAIIRGTSIDADGYVYMDHEATTREDLSIAQAVHNNGGTVVCQFKKFIKNNQMNPQLAKIPAFLIDYYVHDPLQKQTYITINDKFRSGQKYQKKTKLKKIPLDIRKVVARRASLELNKNNVVNLGVGISVGISNIAYEEDIYKDITLTVEAGVIGGIPGSGLDFGTAINPKMIIDQPYQFDFYDGGGLDCAFLSFAEIDQHGNVNVSKFGNRNDGAGGFINIAEGAKKVIFSGTLTSNGLKTKISKGNLKILNEGKNKKFIKNVSQITYNSKLGLKRGQIIIFNTDRGVFKYIKNKITLVEIAQGIRLKEDIINQINFPFIVSKKLKRIPKKLYLEKKIGLKKKLFSN
jgi:propionate CoA-transferase|tara:strand:+ start:1142 stop:2710 length:1569 start_codon:yes stop_codon:yes gene_type:complete